MIIEQQVFDLDAMLAEVNPEPARPPYLGAAPLTFTLDYFTTEQLGAAWDEWVDVHGSFDCIRVSHMWHLSSIDTGISGNGHTCSILHADLRCAHYHITCLCVSSYLYRVQCDACGWFALESESAAVEAWHDHAWPGWRDLPVVPPRVRPIGGGFDKSARAGLVWVEANYPPEWQVAGAPVVTDRASSGTRHVPGYSPWGGYDLAAPTERVAS